MPCLLPPACLILERLILKTVISKGIVNRVAEPLIFATLPLQASRFSQSSKKRYR